MPVRDAGDCIERQLQALTQQHYQGRWEVLVADNGSTDGSAERAARWTDRLPLRVVDASERRGPGAARNQGVPLTSGELLAFCDADDEVQPGWLDALVTRLRDADLVGGAIVHLRPGVRRPPQPPSRSPAMLGWRPYAQTANCGMRRSLWDELGGFDESMVAGEDVDLSWRAQLTGADFEYERGAVVWKHQRPGTRARLRQYYRYGKADVDLFRRYAHAGATRAPSGQLMTSYGGIVVRTFGIASPAVRANWSAQLGRRTGRLVASAERRVWFP